MTAYFSELGITGDSPTEFIEIAVTTGTDTSAYSVVHYMGDGTVYATYSLGTVTSTTAGKDVYTIDDSDPDVPVVLAADDPMGNIYPEDAFALVDGSGTVVQFVSFYGNTLTPIEGPANGMTSTEIGTAGMGNSLQSDDGGSTYYVQSSPNRNSVPCFEAHTRILTQDGYQCVNDLRVGTLVVTADHGLQPIRWIRQYRQDLSNADPGKKPVCIKASALGPKVPKQDLIVSPQHRIVVAGPRQLPELGTREMLVPAKSLTGLPDVINLLDVDEIVWIHFACDRHEVVYANGAAVEALLLSDHVMSGMSNLQRNGLKTCAQTHQRQLGNTRRILPVSKARRLVGAAIIANA
jgi:hypothetical protein